MTTIWMDPTELRATADMLAQQATRIRETAGSTRSACQCEVPGSLAAWLVEALDQVTVDALKVALAYLLEALDCAVRAQEIEADQSLAATQAAFPGMVIAGTSFEGSSGTPGILGGAGMPSGSSWYDALSAYSTANGGLSLTITGHSLDVSAGSFLQFLNAAQDAGYGPAATVVGGYASSVGFSPLSVTNAADDAVMSILAPPGLNYRGGGWVDEQGRWTNNLVNTTRDNGGNLRVL